MAKSRSHGNFLFRSVIRSASNTHSDDLIEMFNGPVARVYELLNNQYHQASQSKKIDLKVSSYTCADTSILANTFSMSSLLEDFQNLRICTGRSRNGLKITASKQFVLLMRKVHSVLTHIDR